jgi:hypothetical protein
MKGSDVLAVMEILSGGSMDRVCMRYFTTPGRVSEAVDALLELGLLERVGEGFSAGLEERVEMAYLALRLGEPLGRVSRALSWRVFEEFVAYIFSSHGYGVKTHYILKGPRAEIDVVAWREDYALVADCKHWSRIIYRSGAEGIVASQVERTYRLLMEGGLSLARAYPVIVTLQGTDQPFHGGVPWIAVNQLNDFLLRFYELRGIILTLEASK